MASFSQAYQLVALAEGGYQNYSEDSGNYNSLGQLVGTNWGINAKVYEKYIGRPPSVADMKTMSKATAIAIYKKNYWDRIKGDSINSQAVANILFDGHVNHGAWGIKMLQEVLRLAKDGVVGNITLNAINQADSSRLVAKYTERRKQAYHWLANNREGQRKFLNGWLNRLKKFVTDNPTQSTGGALLIGTAALFIWLYKKS